MRYEISGHFILRIHLQKNWKSSTVQGLVRQLLSWAKITISSWDLFSYFFSYFFLRLVHLSGSAEMEEVMLLIMVSVMEKSD